jgi:hypothetical protein
MGKFLALLALAMTLCGFRAPDGEIISDGDEESKIVRHLGRPQYISDDGLILIGNAYVKRETWTYQIGAETYYLTMEGGKMISSRWTRR